MGFSLPLLNPYGPYEGKEQFWNNLCALNCLQCENLIIVGDLNLTIHREEIWGPNAREERLANFFVDKFEIEGWVDLEPI